MPISQSTLSAKIKTNILTTETATNDQKLQEFCDAIAKAVVDEIQQNLTLTPTGLSNSGGPVTGTTGAGNFS